MKRLILAISLAFTLTMVLHAAKNSPVTLYSEYTNLSTDKLVRMGQDFDLHNSADSALVCYSVIADRLHDTASSKENIETLARVLNNLGYIYATFLFDYPKAMDYFQEALKLSDSVGYDKNSAFIYLNIGGVYLGCNFMYGKLLFSDEIWEYLEKAVDTGIATESYEVALVAFLNMAQLSFENPQKERILNAISKLKKTDMPQNIAVYPFIRHYADGLELHIRGEHATAKKFFEECPALVPKGSMHQSRLEIIALSAVAESQMSMHAYAAAISTVESLLAKAKSTGATDEETKAYRTLSLLYKKIGNSARSDEFQFQYMHKKDSTLSERDITKLSKMPLINEMEDIKVQLEKERFRKRIFFLTGAAFCIIIVLLTLYLVTLVRNRRKMKSYVKDLYRKNIELMQAEKLEREIREATSTPQVQAQKASKGKYASSTLSETERLQIVDSIRMAMSDTEMITSTDLTLEKLAEKIGYSPRYVSQVVNESFGKNFRSLLNEYRIKEACVRLLDTESYGQFTIETIAETLGFNSRSNFIMTFKKITGLTPSQFQKNASKDE